MPRKKAKLVNNNDVVPLSDWIYGSLLLLVVAIMPIVVRFAITPTPPELQALYGIAHRPDFFSYYKGWVLGISASFILIFCIVEYFMDSIEYINFKALFKSPVVIAIAVFLFMALLSTLFTAYRYTSWRGAAERGEGMWILVAYFIVFFAAMFYVKKARHAKVLMYGLAFSSIIMGLIGLSQFLERDFFMTAFGQWFLRLGMNEATIELMTEGGEGVTSPFVIAYGTLYNPNTFGKYTAMAAPILLACGLSFDAKGLKGIAVRLAFLMGGGLMLVGVFGSRSLGGFVGIAVAIGVVAVTVVCRFFYQIHTRKKSQDSSPKRSDKRIWGYALGGVVVVGLIAVVMFVPVVNYRFETALSRFDEALSREPRPINNIEFNQDRFTLITNGQERFTMVLIEGGERPEGSLQPIEEIRVYDATGQVVALSGVTPHSEPGGPETYRFDVPGYRNINIMRFPDAIIYRDIIMIVDGGRIYSMALNDDIIDVHEPVPAIGFYGREDWGSNRGYIWSRTFPLLPSRVIIGSGPDTFTQVFPQNEVVAKMFLFDNPYIPVDKAHNVFLQAWVGTGGISALALMFLFGYYLVMSFISVVRSDKREGIFLFGLQFGLISGISAFIVGAMSTDSTIGSSGVFYLLLGLGFGVNYLVKRMHKEAV
ncbi:MAG: O-antigen ligase family protein [Defluviitaleaceae bacterium]|nr:O-antigen ligase family protein [Defluviitaleaceae bacterium]